MKTDDDEPSNFIPLSLATGRALISLNVDDESHESKAHREPNNKDGDLQRDEATDRHHQLNPFTSPAITRANEMNGPRMSARASGVMTIAMLICLIASIASSPLISWPWLTVFE